MIGKNTKNEKVKIFISYARRDMDITDRLVLALEAQGFEITVDRRDLPYGEEWQKEIADFIRGCDTVVWLISPHSVISRWCNWELGEVQRLNKRLVPVSIESVAPEALPEGLGKIHVLPVEGGFDFERHMPTLVETLNADRAWLKEHTRLADRARHWVSRDRASALLLRGIALTDAQKWADRKPPKAPYPSEEVLALLLASRRAQSQRQRYALAASLIIAVIGFSLAMLAYWQRDVAIKQRELAQHNENQARRNFAIGREVLERTIEDFSGGLRQLAGIRSGTVERILSRLEKSVNDFGKNDFDHNGVKLVRWLVFREFGKTYFASHQDENAIRYLKMSLDEIRSVQGDLSESMEFKYKLLMTLIDFAFVNMHSGDFNNSIDIFKEAEVLAEQLTQVINSTKSEPIYVVSAMSMIYRGQAEAQVANGDVAGAMDLYAKSLTINKLLLKNYNDVIEFHINKSAIIRGISRLFVRIGKSKEAFELCRDSHFDSINLAERYSEVSLAQVNLLEDRILTASIADEVSPAWALTLHESAVELARRVYNQNPSNIDRQADLIIALNAFAAAKRKTGDDKTATTSYEQALMIARGIVHEKPDFAKQHSTDYEKLLLSDEDGNEDGNNTKSDEKIYAKYDKDMKIALDIVHRDFDSSFRMHDLLITLEKDD